ncbi:hypothetical protein MNBD_GAMMA10-2151 [hydrothermal vent metagenome]|uniref:Uncharacterized protein n=1 Tax=hydrothermal vent metagenome TaxID=652676 RepID=A0A3B0Y1F6_9ZZZZ
MRPITTFLAALSINLIFSTTLFSAEDEFSFICDVFNKSITSPEYKGLGKQEKLNLINTKIWAGLKTDTAKEMLSAIASASPDLKYQFLKEGIELETGKKWDCPVMRDY